jgi:signal transduction histidine kinase
MTPQFSVDRFDWISRLHRIGQAIAHDNPARVRSQLLEHIVEGFSATSGSLALLDASGKTLTIVAATGGAARYVGHSIALGDGVLGWVAQQRQPLLLNGDVASDPRFHNLARRDAASRPHSALCWPLTIETRVIGAISINRDPSRPPFVQNDMAEGWIMVSLLAIVVENIQLQVAMRQRIAEQQELIGKLNDTRSQLLQAEKMAAVGQLAAGVAHEINNPIGYVNSNLGTLGRYVGDLLGLLELYTHAEPELPAAGREAIENRRDEIDLDFLRQDVVELVAQSREGVERVKKIVQDLQQFSRADDAKWLTTDLHEGLETTLNIVWNELKYKAQVIKEYGELPRVECLPSQLNQVFMNLLVNAAQAIETRGTVTIRTGRKDEQVFVEIRDTGKGIAPEHMKRLFEPFFTTKPVGQGTGLGLSLSYRIIQRHGGRIEVESEPGRGTVFRVWVPVRQGPAPADNAHAQHTSSNSRSVA